MQLGQHGGPKANHPEDWFDRQPRRLSLHQESSRASLALCEDQKDAGYLTEADPFFAPVQYVHVARKGSRSGDASRIAANSRLRQGESSQLGARRQTYQPLSPLLFVSPLKDT